MKNFSGGGTETKDTLQESVQVTKNSLQERAQITKGTL
jgi:hypothetical protein